MIGMEKRTLLLWFTSTRTVYMITEPVKNRLSEMLAEGRDPSLSLYLSLNWLYY